MFGRKKTEEDAVVGPPPVEDAPAEPTTVGKGRPTPRRRDAEAANRRPLISGDPKADKARARTIRAKERALMEEALRTGDEKHLPPQHKGPARRFARDWLDSRWQLGEIFMPVALLVVVVVFGGAALNLDPGVIIIAMLVLYAVVIVAAIEAIVLSIIVRKRALARFGRPAVRGLRLYTAMRSMQLRAMRQPKPQVKRGEHPS